MNNGVFTIVDDRENLGNMIRLDYMNLNQNI